MSERLCRARRFASAISGSSEKGKRERCSTAESIIASTRMRRQGSRPGVMPEHWRRGQTSSTSPYRTTADTPTTRLASIAFEFGVIEMFWLVPEVGSVMLTAEPTALPAVP